MSPRAAARLESFGFREVYDYAAGKSDWFAFGLPMEGEGTHVPRAGQFARRDVPTCHPDERVGAVRERAAAAGWDTCVVVDHDRVVLGLLDSSRLAGESDRTAEEAMELGPSTFRPDAELERLLDYMRRHHRSVVLVTTPDGRLVGLVRRVDVGSTDVLRG